MQLTRRKLIAQIGGAAAAAIVPGVGFGQKPTTSAKRAGEVEQYLGAIYAEGKQQYRFRADYPGGFERWQQAARPELAKLIGLENIAAENVDHKATVQLSEPEDRGNHTIRRLRIRSRIAGATLLQGRRSKEFVVG